MNSLDYIILIPVLTGLIIGLFKGLIKEVIGLAVIVLGIYIAKLLGPLAGELLISLLDISPTGAQPLGFIAVFAVVAILLTLIGKLTQGLVNVLSLGFLNTLVGGIFGALKVALVISILLNVLAALDHKFSIIDPESKDNSLLYEPVTELAPELWEDLSHKSSRNAEATVHN